MAAWAGETSSPILAAASALQNASNEAGGDADCCRDIQSSGYGAAGSNGMQCCSIASWHDLLITAKSTYHCGGFVMHCTHANPASDVVKPMPLDVSAML